MKSPIKNFDPYTDPTGLHSPGSLRTIARRIKTRALRAVGHVGRFFSAAMKVTLVVWLLWPLWLAIDCVFLSIACDPGCDDVRREAVTMPQQDATTHASDADRGRHE